MASASDSSLSAGVSTSVGSVPILRKSTFAILLKNGTTIPTATVDEQIDKSSNAYDPDITYTITLGVLPDHINHMLDYLTELCDKMMKYDIKYPYSQQEQISIIEYSTQYHIFNDTEFIRGIIFYRWTMRKGSYFYVIQYSDRGIRFLLYTLDRARHSSNSFGSSLMHPNLVEQKTNMKQQLQSFTDEQIMSLNINVPYFRQAVENDLLYFL